MGGSVDWDAIGAIGEVAGAIAVVATLVYLARQIRHSAEATRIAAFHQAQEQLWSMAETVATDRDLANLVAGTLGGGLDDLNPQDRVRLEFALTPLFFGFEGLLALYEKGHIDPELWDNLFANNFHLISSKLGREYLATRRGPISRRLEARVNEHLEKRGQV